MMDIPEPDWKILRRVHAVALERFCERVLAECHEILNGRTGSAYDRYLELYRHLRSRDRSIALAFDDMRRSRAMDRLVAMLQLDVVTGSELAQFSPAVRERAQAILLSRSETPEE